MPGSEVIKLLQECNLHGNIRIIDITGGLLFYGKTNKGRIQGWDIPCSS